MRKRVRGDGGASATIEFLLMLIIIIFIFVVVIDSGLYFLTRNILTNAAQNGARLAAIYGGASDTPISREYGTRIIHPQCANAGANNLVSCSVVAEIAEGGMTDAVRVSEVKCGPAKTTQIGERTWCEIKWRFRGLSGAFRGQQTIRGTAESEVLLR